MRNFSILFCFFLAYFGVSYAQTQGIAYTAVGKGVATTFLTDYHSLGINNSALGWGTGYEDKHFTIGTTEFNFGIMSPTLDKSKLKNAFNGMKNQIGGKGGNLTSEERKQVVGDYAEAGLGITANYNWLGASYQSEKFGGIAISINENYEWFSQLNEKTTDIVFRGKFAGLFDSLTVVMGGDTSRIANSGNISQDTLNAVVSGTINHPTLISDITKGSKIKFLWNRTYNIGYGRKIIGNPEEFAIYGGVGFRYIQSVAMFDLESNESGLRATTALSPFFQIDQGNGVGKKQKFLPESVGSGYGVDVSASIIMFGKIRLAAAINNVGSVKYTRNVYSIKDTLLGSYSLEGLSNSDISQSFDALADANGLLNSEGEDKIVINNPANFRLGGSLLLFEDRLQVGFDVVAPFNKDQPGSLRNTIVSFGGEIRPVKWLQLSVGYLGGGVYQHNIPVGINFVLGQGTYEFGIASRDAISFFYKDAHSISMAMGVARFRF